MRVTELIFKLYSLETRIRGCFIGFSGSIVACYVVEILLSTTIIEPRVRVRVISKEIIIYMC